MTSKKPAPVVRRPSVRGMSPLAQAYLDLDVLKYTLTPDEIGAKINRTGSYVKRILDGERSLTPLDAERVLAIPPPDRKAEETTGRKALTPEQAKEARKQRLSRIKLRVDALKIVDAAREQGLARTAIARVVGINRDPIDLLCNGGWPYDRNLEKIVSARAAIETEAKNRVAKQASMEAEKDLKANAKAEAQARRKAEKNRQREAQRAEREASRRQVPTRAQVRKQELTDLVAAVSDLVRQLLNQGLSEHEIARLSGHYKDTIADLTQPKPRQRSRRFLRQILDLRDDPAKAASVSALIEHKKAQLENEEPDTKAIQAAEKNALHADAVELIQELIDRGLTQREIAELAGCSASVLFTVIRFKYRDFRIELLRQILALRDDPAKAAEVAARIAQARP
jgi:predicted XRE-type DNA-binding protein